LEAHHFRILHEIIDTEPLLITRYDQLQLTLTEHLEYLLGNDLLKAQQERLYLLLEALIHPPVCILVHKFDPILISDWNLGSSMNEIKILIRIRVCYLEGQAHVLNIARVLLYLDESLVEFWIKLLELLEEVKFAEHPTEEDLRENRLDQNLLVYSS
jgi:hypothetical protein